MVMGLPTSLRLIGGEFNCFRRAVLVETRIMRWREAGPEGLGGGGEGGWEDDTKRYATLSPPE